MMWLLLSILSSVLIFVVFNLFKRYGVDNLQAIVVNYAVAFSVGSLAEGFQYSPWEVPEQRWFSSVLLLGLLFITLFRLMAFVSQHFGVAAVSVAVKMSVVMPVVFGLWYFGESLSALKLSGITLSLVAVLLATYRPGSLGGSTPRWQLIAYPLILFVGSGFIDLFLKYNQASFVPPEEQGWFATSIFGAAAIFGALFVLLQRWFARVPFQPKALLGGLALGIPNYGSIYFLLRALSVPQWESSSLFALNNLGIVACSTLVGAFAFREKLSGYNIAGVLLAGLSIYMITKVL